MLKGSLCLGLAEGDDANQSARAAGHDQTMVLSKNNRAAGQGRNLGVVARGVESV